MRPETARYKVRQSIREAKDKIQEAVDYSLEKADIKQFKGVLLELEQILTLCERQEGKDSSESYYGDCREVGTLMYISDRWNCTGRIKWLIDVLKENEL